MKKYNIMIIDDDFTNRKVMYEEFLEKQYEEIDIHFNLFFIEYARDLRAELLAYSKEIDAFFLDAVLDKNGWSRSGISFETILHQMETIYAESRVPPIFMLSSEWHKDMTLLTRVNKDFSIFHNPLHPSRYYTQSEIEGVNQNAQSVGSDGKRILNPLRDEREYIANEILKARSNHYNSLYPVDVVLQLAVADEKRRAYQVLNLREEKDEYLKEYNLSYQETTIKGDARDYHVVVVTQTTMGMTDASRTTTAAILAFRPRLIVMTGICAGLKEKTSLCDLIAVKNTFDYSFGKLFIDKLEHRPEPLAINPGLTNFVNANLLNNAESIFVEINNNYHGDAPSGCRIHFASMGSGPWVVDNPSVFSEIRDHIVGNCISLDMEAYGVAAAAHQLRTPWFILKSVQDYADGEKNSAETKSRAYAAYSSTYILQRYLPKILDYL